MTSERPPKTIGNGRVLYFAVIDEGVRPTGATRHTFGQVIDGDVVPGRAMEPFNALAIVQYEGDRNVHLLYLDGRREEVTDTWHETVEAAKTQAEFEYEGINGKWVEVSAP